MPHSRRKLGAHLRAHVRCSQQVLEQVVRQLPQLRLLHQRPCYSHCIICTQQHQHRSRQVPAWTDGNGST